MVGTSESPLTAFLGSSGVAPVGIAEIAFAPAGFFSTLDPTLIATFYGNGPAGASNTNNPVLLVDTGSGNVFPMIAAGTPGIGHITSVLAAGNSLFLADLSSTDYFQPGGGVIYQITADSSVPEPASSTLLLFGFIMTLGCRWRRSR